MSDERIDGHAADDEGLGRRLRDAIPAPGPGYWEAIDGALAEIEPDTDRSVVRLMDMENDAKAPRTPRHLPAMAAAAVLVLVAAVAVILRIGDDGSTDLVTDTVDETPPTTADDGGRTEGPSSGAAISCYLGDETPVGLVVRLEETDDGKVLAATHFAPGAGADTIVTVAEGTVLDDGQTLQMLEVTVGDGAVSTMLWLRTESGLALAEDVAVRPVDCAQVADELVAIDAALAALPADPLDEARRWGQLTGSDVAMAAGTYCFANDDEESPFDSSIRLTVNDDATATAVTSNGSPPVVTGNATGTFSTPTEIVMTVDRFAESRPVSSFEVWRLVPLTGELIRGPLFRSFDPVGCAETDQVSSGTDEAWPAETPLSRLYGAGLVSTPGGISSIFEDGAVQLIDEPATVAFATPGANIVYETAGGAIRVRDTDGGTSTLVEAPDGATVRLLSVLRYPTDDDVRVAYALRTGVGSEDESETVGLLSLDDPDDVIDLGMTGGIEQTVTSISAADGTLLLQVNTPGFVENRVFTTAGEQEPIGLLADVCPIGDAGCPHPLHLVAGGRVVYLRRPPTGTEIVLAEAGSGTPIAFVPVGTDDLTGLDAVGRRAIVNGSGPARDDVGVPILVDFGQREPLVVELPVTGFATLLRD